MQRPPQEAGLDLADWHWKVVRRFAADRFGITLSRSSCRNYLHRLGFVVTRPKKRLLKADEARREAFVAADATLRTEAQTSGRSTPSFFAGLAGRKDEVKQRCRTELQARADALDAVRAAITLLHEVRM